MPWWLSLILAFVVALVANAVSWPLKKRWEQRREGQLRRNKEGWEAFKAEAQQWADDPELRANGRFTAQVRILLSVASLVRMSMAVSLFTLSVTVALLIGMLKPSTLGMSISAVSAGVFGGLAYSTFRTATRRLSGARRIVETVYRAKKLAEDPAAFSHEDKEPC